MLDTAKLKKHLSAGNPTKYEKHKHIDLLVDIFSSGEDIAAFCDEAIISKQTFYNWLKIHKEFKESYDIVINKAERKWAAYPKENPDFNLQYWHMIMKNRFGYGKPRIQVSDDITPIGRITSIWKGVEEGELTTDEISKIASLALTQANIESNGAFTNQAEHVRLSREELGQKVENFVKAMDYMKREDPSNSHTERKV
jgi:hypothetical protein